MDLLPEKKIKQYTEKSLPKNATRKQRKRAAGFLEKMASMRAAKQRKADEYRKILQISVEKQHKGGESSPTASNITNDGGRLKSYLVWLDKIGVKGHHENVSFNYSADGKVRCTAKRCINVGDVILEIPETAMLSYSPEASGLPYKAVPKFSLSTMAQNLKDAAEEVKCCLGRNKAKLCMLVSMVFAYYNFDDPHHQFMRSFDLGVNDIGQTLATSEVIADISKTANHQDKDTRDCCKHLIETCRLSLERDIRSELCKRSSEQCMVESNGLYLPIDWFNRQSMKWAEYIYDTMYYLVEDDESSIAKYKVLRRLGTPHGDNDELNIALIPVLNLFVMGDTKKEWLKLELGDNSVRVICKSSRQEGDEIFY